MVAAFEAIGYRPRDDDVYVMFGDPGRMVGRVTLRDDRTLFLFVFIVDGRIPEACPMLRDRKRYCMRGSATGYGSAREFLMLSTVQTLFISIVSARSGCQRGRKAASRLSAMLPIARLCSPDKVRR